MQGYDQCQGTVFWTLEALPLYTLPTIRQLKRDKNKLMQKIKN